jgi:aspartate--ammonia ligase
MYKSKLNLIETEVAIKLIKDTFEKELAKNLNLTRVSAPLFVAENTGINDNLNGIERPVSFLNGAAKLEIVQSLAKWKRLALANYKFKMGQGLYTDMNAIRQDEVLDRTHSLYVDQWDWELVISKKERHLEFLKLAADKVYQALIKTNKKITKSFPQLKTSLPNKLTFITTDTLVDMYPDKNSKQREDLAAKKFGAIFIIGIGGKTKEGKPHDLRSPDYDDWKLNGDLIVYSQTLNSALELSSMGIRVDAKTLKEQLTLTNTLERSKRFYHQQILKDKIPLTIGGGIGQSRLCMFLLEKVHIGEVQSSYWPDKIIKECQKQNIFLL